MKNTSSAEETLGSLQQVLSAMLGENLISIVRHGQADTKIQVLIVVESLDRADWQQLSLAFDNLRGRASLVPVLLTHESLKSSTDIFPILIHQIKQGYEVLHGADVVAEVELQRAHLRLRCEQELRSLQLEMQSTCLMHFASPHRLRTALIRDCQSFLPLIKVAFELNGNRIESTDALVDATAAKFDLDRELLAYAVEFAHGGGEFNAETFGGVYTELMAAVRMAANFTDQLPNPPQA